MIAHPFYLDDVRNVSSLPLPWETLRGARILIAGARGLIGSFLVDTLLEKNRSADLGMTIIAAGRDTAKGLKTFADYSEREDFRFVETDVNKPIDAERIGRSDIVIHLASNTHPVAYANDPIGTISANVAGTGNLLAYAAACGAKRFVFASSNEIYGENRGDTELFREDSCGYIDCNTLRAGYPESKRCGEALCQAYHRSTNLDVVIPRLTRSYGPTLLATDTKALSQFLHKALAGEDIVLKSEGHQYYSFTYMADAVSGLLTVLLKGVSGEAYNIADLSGDITLGELAQLIAKSVGRRVVFDLPTATERAGFSKATKARLDGTKLRALGWKPRYNIADGIRHTLQIMRDTEAARANDQAR